MDEVEVDRWRDETCAFPTNLKDASVAMPVRWVGGHAIVTAVTLSKNARRKLPHHYVQ